MGRRSSDETTLLLRGKNLYLSTGAKPHHVAWFQGYRMDPGSLHLPVRLRLRTHTSVGHSEKDRRKIEEKTLGKLWARALKDLWGPRRGWELKCLLSTRILKLIWTADLYQELHINNGRYSQQSLKTEYFRGSMCVKKKGRKIPRELTSGQAWYSLFIRSLRYILFQGV